MLRANLASAQHQAHALNADVKAYKLQFFTVQENDLLDRVAEMILPADSISCARMVARRRRTSGPMGLADSVLPRSRGKFISSAVATEGVVAISAEISLI